MYFSLLYVCYVFGPLTAILYRGWGRLHPSLSLILLEFDKVVFCLKLLSNYMNDPLMLISNYDIGCFMNKICFNKVFYADNLCFLATCAISL